MKFVSYDKDNWHFLPDDTFDAVARAWVDKKSAYVESLGLYLPPTQRASGTPREHDGLEIFWDTDQGGWWAKDVSGAWYAREKAPGDGFYSWVVPSGAAAAEHLVPVDRCLKDRLGAFPYDMLLPKSFQE